MKSPHDLRGAYRAARKRWNRQMNVTFERSRPKVSPVPAAEHARQRAYFNSAEYALRSAKLDILSKACQDSIDAVDKANLSTTRYAVVVPADQTIMYLTEDGDFTTKHPEAWLSDCKLFAEKAAAEVKGTVECIPSLSEFLNREDTW